jgi:hypothetical protein
VGAGTEAQMASERIGINHRVRSPILMSIDQSQLHRQPTVPRPLGASFNVRAEDALGALAVGERWNVRAIVEPKQFRYQRTSGASAPKSQTHITTSERVNTVNKINHGVERKKAVESGTGLRAIEAGRTCRFP